MGAGRTKPLESLTGLIERVTFHNEDTGFAVLKIKAKGHRNEVAVVGALASANPGEWLTAEGQWVQDREFGLQFRAQTLTSTAPTTRAGIEKYLGSGLIKGIGPVYARKLVERFGEKVLEVIEHQSARLEEVDGIGPERRRRIKQAWAEQKSIGEIMLFLHSHGVSTSRAVRIFKLYGETAIDEVRSNPYRLARDIPGIGFRTADQIAGHLGIPHDSILRAAAGLAHVLLEATSQGHCALPLALLKEQAGKLLLTRDEVVEAALERAFNSGELSAETIGGEELVFLPRLKHAEATIARRIKEIAALPPCYPTVDIAKALAWCEQKTGKVLAPSQRAAVQQALASRILVITGGPGVGKTTLVNAILLILRAKQVKCELCAPTGRAAKRLGEATGLEARTIHRLLEAQPGRAGFVRNETNPLRCDLVVVDEMSMVDVPLMQHLVSALPRHASLLLVGDADQLPSVGPGMVLRDLIESRIVPVAALTEVFRQAAGSHIITNAHRINQGSLPESGAPDSGSDFFLVNREAPERILETLLELATRRVPSRFKLDPLTAIQVLTPMNRGLLGVTELNSRLQEALNPQAPGEPLVEKFGTRFCLRDKVMQTENNYDKEVFNGDIGQVVAISDEERELTASFDGRQVRYGFGELDELVLAYAITIHKSQGSEFPCVILPLATQHYLLLQRNLVYTGVTRGKRLVIVVGQPRALRLAVENNRTSHRYSGLLARLQT